MSLARIITRLPEASCDLAEQLRARGFTVETRSLREDFAPPGDLEILLEECDVEDALQRASLEVGPGCVFIGPGAIAEDFRPIAVIPVLPSVAAAAVHKQWVPEKLVCEKPIPEFEVLPAEIVSEVTPVAHIVEPEMAGTPVLSLAPTPLPIEPALEQPIVAPDAASIGDLAAQLRTGESASEASLQAETASLEPVPALLETQTTPGIESAGAEVPGTTSEIHVDQDHVPEVRVTEVQLHGDPLPEVRLEDQQREEQLVFAEAATEPTTAQPESARCEEHSGPMRPSELPAAPGVPLADVEEVAPVVCTEPRAEGDVAVIVALKPEGPEPVRPSWARRFSALKVHIWVRRLPRSSYYWGAAVLATVIAVEALVLIFAAPVSPRAGVVPNPGRQLARPQAQNSAPAVKAATISKPNSLHRPVRAADEGYVAKNTVIHYGSRPATPSAAKSAARPRSTAN